jgi:hypothetical protein
VAHPHNIKLRRQNHQESQCLLARQRPKTKLTCPSGPGCASRAGYRKVDFGEPLVGCAGIRIALDPKPSGGTSGAAGRSAQHPRGWRVHSGQHGGAHHGKAASCSKDEDLPVHTTSHHDDHDTVTMHHLQVEGQGSPRGSPCTQLRRLAVNKAAQVEQS